MCLRTRPLDICAVSLTNGEHGRLRHRFVEAIEAASGGSAENPGAADPQHDAEGHEDE